MEAKSFFGSAAFNGEARPNHASMSPEEDLFEREQRMGAGANGQ